MSSKGVYLVSSTPVGTDSSQKQGFDNLAYKATDTNVTYNESNGVSMPEVKPIPDKPYRGMGKDDLLHFSTQPFWRRLRMICVSFVVLGWLALIIAVVALVLIYPSCRDPGSRSWWQTEAVYRIYVPSFKDSDDDGVGDLAGIESKLDYIKGLGFGIISLSPLYTTGQSSAQFGSANEMAVTNHTNIHTKYGTLTDFDKLVKTAHDKGMYVILDFIPNHTSKEHPWFIESRGSTTNNKKNFYVWADGTITPNNWKSQYTGSAWSNDSSRNQMYYHHYGSDTPDLNLRSAMVLDELEAILDFWLDRGVDGFNVRDAAYLYEDYDLRDEPKSGSSGSSYDDLDHMYTSNQPEVYNVLERWRKFIQEHNFTNTEKLLMASTEGDLDVTELYSECDRSGIQMPLNEALLEKSDPCNGNCITQYVDGWMNKVPSGKWANWMAGDEDSDRFANRFNASFIQAYTILTFLMPGTPLLYYGDEINMVNTGPANDVASRDQPMRAIMRWDNSTNGGFCNSTCSPWTDIGDVSTGQIKNALSNLIKDLVALRAEESFRVGDYFGAVRDSNVVSFVREFDGETGYLVAVNFGPNEVSRDFVGSHDTIPDKAEVVLSHSSSYSLEDEVEMNGLEIGPYGGVVVSWDYVAKEL